MNRQKMVVGLLVCLLVSSVGTISTWAQTSGAIAPEASAPRLVQFSGVLKDHMGQPLTGVQGLTFSLYKEQQGGTALWLETQNVTADEQGGYSVLLGATTSNGLPLELFSSNEARWLGIQVNLPGEVEQSRLLLVNVPYALKAADAETLGGKPLSAFVLASEVVTTRVKESGGLQVAALSGGPITAQATAGTAGRIAKFINSVDLGDSALFESGGNIGLGTASPASTLDVRGTLRVQSPNTTQSVFIYAHDTLYYRYPYQSYNRSRGTVESPADVQIGDYIGATNFYGYNGAAYTGVAGFSAVM